MTERQTAERQMRAIEKIASSAPDVVRALVDMRKSIESLNKTLKEFQETELAIKVDASQLDLPLENDKNQVSYLSEFQGHVYPAIETEKQKGP